MVSSSHEILIGRANQEETMGWACCKMQRNVYRISAWKPEETPPLGRHRGRSGDDIKMILKK
jgi:hypothetical protein